MSNESVKFDSIYREKSSHAVLMILDHVKSRLAEEGFFCKIFN